MSGLKEMIRAAIRKEKQAYDLYRLVNAATTDAARRKLTRQLADDAVRHLAIIARACRSRWPSLTTYLEHLVPEIDLTGDTEDELAEALESAVAHKRELVELYTALSNREDEPHWNKMFRELVETEAAHLEFIRTRLPSV
jgi:rubrerythrin